MLKKYSPTIKPSFEQLTPYVPGKNAEKVKRELKLERVVKLASNENPFGPGPKALQAVQKYQGEFHLYPDSDETLLRKKISGHFSVEYPRIIIGSGSDSLLHSIGQTFLNPGDEVIISQFAFATYEIVTLANQGVPITIPANKHAHDLKGMLNKISARTKLIFLANPNNPTGTWFSHSELEYFLNRVPEHIPVVLDEAYFEFMHDQPNYPDSLQLQKSYPNLIITRTFSKAYGLAGLRVGYAFADESIIELLNRIRSPFTVSVPAQVAATAALDDIEFLQRTVSHSHEMRKMMVEALERLKLVNIARVGNFVTVDFKQHSQAVFEYFLKQGIILRPLKNYRMDNFLRISFGLKDDMERVIELLGKYYN